MRRDAQTHQKSEKFKESTIICHLAYTECQNEKLDNAKVACVLLVEVWIGALKQKSNLAILS